MAQIATPAFLSNLKSLYPSSTAPYLKKPWFLVAAVAFSASNEPDAVPLVFKDALSDLQSQSASDKDCILLVRKMKDALFKSGLLCGYPKAINGLAALHQVVPAKYRDKEPLRDTSLSTETLRMMGQNLFDKTYGETSASVQSFLRDIYPDFEHFSTTFGYGYVYDFSEILSPMETSFTMAASLIPIDTPKQIEWHLKSSLRNGASIEEVKALREIALTVAKAAGVVWKHDVPELPM